jgi:hypothetical protein
VYISSKPAKYGVKIQILADSQTHYMLNAEVYTVKALVRANKTTLSHPTQVVLRMVKPVENTNRNITVNNWYTSMELVDQLKKKGLTYVHFCSRKKHTSLERDFCDFLVVSMFTHIKRSRYVLFLWIFQCIVLTL